MGIAPTHGRPLIPCCVLMGSRFYPRRTTHWKPVTCFNLKDMIRYALSRVARLTGRQTEQILKPGKQPARVYAGSLLCHWAIRRLGGMTAVAVSKLRSCFLVSLITANRPFTPRSPTTSVLWCQNGTNYLKK
jgi:hypothetical protein